MTKQKNDPFETVSENLPFFPDKETGGEQSVICLYDNETVLGDDPDPLKRIPVFIVVDMETGEKKYITQSYAIKKAIETARKKLNTLKDVVFRFTFKGQTIVNGKPFNQFNTAFCTLKDYENSLKG